MVKTRLPHLENDKNHCHQKQDQQDTTDSSNTERQMSVEKKIISVRTIIHCTQMHKHKCPKMFEKRQNGLNSIIFSLEAIFNTITSLFVQYSFVFYT